MRQAVAVVSLWDGVAWLSLPNCACALASMEGAGARLWTWQSRFVVQYAGLGGASVCGVTWSPGHIGGNSQLVAVLELHNGCLGGHI